MPIVLKRFSQDVDLENPEVSSNYLVLSTDGREFRVPVPPETIRELTAQIYQQPVSAEEVEEEDDVEEREATEQDVEEEDLYQQALENTEEEDEEEATVYPPRRVIAPPRPKTPASEDEVPSL